MKNVIAHRGYSSIYGDNNFVSFQKAIDNNFDYIEMDLQLNKDNEIVIFHNLYHNNQYIKQMNNDEIKNNSIPFFYEFIEKFDYQNIKIILDLKGDNILSNYLLEFFNNNKINTSNIIIASFNENHLLPLKNKNLNLGFITSNIFNSNYFFNIIHDYKYILTDIDVVNNNFIDLCHKHNKIVFCFTCHNNFEKNILLNLNLDGIISNIKIKK